MTAVITHSVSAGGTVDATADVDGAAWDANHVITGVMSPTQGGTGVANNDASTITISGSFGATFTLSATTSVTFPTTGTLATLGGPEAFTNKTYNGNTWTAGTGVLTIAAAKTLTASNTLTFTGTDGSSVAFGTGGTVVYTASYGTGVVTALAVNVGSAGAFVVNGGAGGTPSSLTLTNATGLPIGAGVSGLGTGIATALAINTGSAGAPVLFNGAGGTPSSLALTNATGLPLTGLATQAAYSIVGNFTGSSAVPTASTIPALTNKATPVGADTIILADSAASNALKYATLTQALGAAGVASYNTRTGAVTATGTDVPLRSYLAGLTLSTAGASQVFSIAAGVCTDSTNVSMMSLGAFTKTAVGGNTWTLGSGGSVLDTGAYSTNTWYNVFVIQRPDTGVVDVLLSLSATSPTLPTNYTLFRRIGSLRSDSVAGRWTKFYQNGDYFLWDAPPIDINTSSQGTTATLYTLLTPSGVKTRAVLSGYMNHAIGGNGLQIYDPDVTTPGNAYAGLLTVAATNQSFNIECQTNTSSQVYLDATASSTTAVVTTVGWHDRRGRDT